MVRTFNRNLTRKGPLIDKSRICNRKDNALGQSVGVEWDHFAQDVGQDQVPRQSPGRAGARDHYEVVGNFAVLQGYKYFKCGRSVLISLVIDIVD